MFGGKKQKANMIINPNQSDEENYQNPLGLPNLDQGFNQNYPNQMNQQPQQQQQFQQQFQQPINQRYTQQINAEIVQATVTENGFQYVVNSKVQFNLGDVTIC